MDRMKRKGSFPVDRRLKEAVTQYEAPDETCRNVLAQCETSGRVYVRAHIVIE